MDPLILLAVLAVAAIGGAGGFALRSYLTHRILKESRQKASHILEEAEEERKKILLEAKEEALKIRSQAEKEIRERYSDLNRRERRLMNREESLERRANSLEQKERSLHAKEKELEQRRLELEDLKSQELQKLETIGGMSLSEAREYLLRKTEEEMRYELARKYAELEQRLKEEAGQKAKDILAQAISRLAVDVVSEATTTVIPLPSDDIKGRIIGREGRNIRAFENATGVEVIIDDTPEVVTLSCFDPVRRETARLAMSKLIMDGRIQPARIEEFVEKARKEVEEVIKAEGEKAVLETGVRGLHPDLVKLLGRLTYRFSYGQNVLKHSIEVSLLAGMLAAEIGADVEVAKMAGLLQDIGKAVSHEVEGAHPEIGAEIARKYKLPPKVQLAIREHHEDTKSTVESFLVSAADAISASRPGARRESLEEYLRRLQELEAIARSFPGVDQAFAIHAGRELRIMVKPQEMDDIAATKLARDVAKKIEATLTYPGQIKVTVIRETRAVEFAK